MMPFRIEKLDILIRAVTKVRTEQMQKKKSTVEEWIQGRKCVQINALQFDKMNELVAGRYIYP